MTTTTWGFFPVSLSCTYSGDLFLMKLFYSSSAGEHIEHRLKVLLSLILSL